MTGAALLPIIRRTPSSLVAGDGGREEAEGSSVAGWAAGRQALPVGKIQRSIHAASPPEE